MTQEILALCGIPGSGKTTFARELIAANPSYLRLNNDELGEMLGLVRSEMAATLLVDITTFLAKRAIETGNSLLVDNTNLSAAARLHMELLASTCGVPLRWMYFDDSLDLDLCLHRNAQRTGVARVPDDVIRAMHAQYMELER